MPVSRPPFILPCGACSNATSTPQVPQDQKVHLSIYTSPSVAYQVGDVINYYAKVINLTGENIDGPIEIYVAGVEEPALTIVLKPYEYGDSTTPYTVTTDDIGRKFLVSTIYARLANTGDDSGCIISNIATVSVLMNPI